MNYIPLVDASLVLQASVTKTASFDSAWIDLGKGFEAGGLGLPLGGVVTVTALDLASTNETYTFKLQEADVGTDGAVNASTARDIGVAVSATAAGIVVPKGLVTSRFVRLVLTAGGTTPSITYSALLGR